MNYNNNIYYPFVDSLYNPLPILWDGICTISVYQEVTDPETFQTHEELVPIIENEPCRLSNKTNTVVADVENVAETSKTIVLFLRPDLEVPAGSVIDVTQYGRTTKFKNSSTPSVYYTHQEIQLSIYNDKA